MDDSAGSLMAGQVRRLRQAATESLAGYDIEATRVRLLAHHRQTTFQVISGRDGERYLLRLHRAARRPPAAVQFELWWLAELRDKTKIVAPLAVTAKDGRSVLPVRGMGIPDDLYCSLLRWVPGRRYFRRTGPGVWVLHEVGRHMAVMHDLAQRCNLPRTPPPVPIWNAERLFGVTEQEKTAERQQLTLHQRKLFQRAARQAAEVMEHLGVGRQEFGLIHADLIQSNYLVHRGAVHLIDFAELGLGHYLYDLAVTIYGLWGLDPQRNQRQALLEGYRLVRELPMRQVDLLDRLVAGRAVVQGRFVMSSEHAADREIAPRYVRQALDCLTAYSG
ncbi:MAG TPA: phosphotransferase [Pirellulaceae bacterium]|nr:phosphotransferase [Pirellulaceae bacterium]